MRFIIRLNFINNFLFTKEEKEQRLHLLILNTSYYYFLNKKIFSWVKTFVTALKSHILQLLMNI